MNKQVFALDVGTRNVVGLLAEYNDNKICIKDFVSKEHETRAMEDGQIHDIAKVAYTVEMIKKELEEKHDLDLKEVAVAVAGRALITQEGIADKDLSVKDEISEEEVLSVEILAIQKAMATLDKKYKEYHCVGYSVSEYFLDGEHIKNPIYQKGAKLKVEVLATFLPKQVVDSMFTMVKKLGMTITNLSLEPIAAINVVIPEDMRKLNLALVDVGAGTSDIAITKDGKVIGYEMVPMAGDEITEKIASDYLLDFSTAEEVKRELKEKEETVKYNDILGMEYEIPKIEILNNIEEILEDLSSKISEKILHLNKATPQAVILIGGGSLIPELKEKITEKLSLSVGRTAVRGTEAIRNLVDETKKLKTSEFVTPIGIANMAFKGKDFKIIACYINNTEYRILSFKSKISLMDCLISSGLDLNTLYTKPGMPLTIRVNKNLRIIKGEEGKPAVIKVNSKIANLESEIEDGDEIELSKFRDGRDAILTLKDLKAEVQEIELNFNGKKINLKPEIWVNGELQEDKYILKDRDEVEIKDKFLLKDLLKGENSFEKEMKFTLNGSVMKINIPSSEFIRNEEKISLNSEIFFGDEIKEKEMEELNLKIRDVIDYNHIGEEIRVSVNGKTIKLGNSKIKLKKNERLVDPDTAIFNGDIVETIQDEEKLPIVSDIFKFFNPEEIIKEKGGVLRIEVNNEKAEFVTKLKNNDIIKMYYK